LLILNFQILPHHGRQFFIHLSSPPTNKPNIPLILCYMKIKKGQSDKDFKTYYFDPLALLSAF
ncbi:MAG: hypothetical protein KJ983_01235, partial [Candidatus Omnitrophica bacterium]|nr:hypothetical protein [Candidatus Omnitrophota bacterium]